MPPFAAMPDASATAFSSAMPTSINCLPAFLRISSVKPSTVGVPEVIMHTDGSACIFFSIKLSVMLS